MPNPYQPPTTDSARPELTGDAKAVRFAGGWVGILAIGAIAGAAAMLFFELIDHGMSWAVNPFVVIGMFWFAALLASTVLLRGVSVSFAGRIVITLLALPAAVVLYVPVCSVGSMALAGGSYMVDGFPMVLGSAVSFAGVLYFICRVIRRIMLRRQARQDMLPANQSDFQ